MVHTLFLTDSRKFNPTKYTTYTVPSKGKGSSSKNEQGKSFVKGYIIAINYLL